MLDGMIQGKLNTLVPAGVNSGWRGQSPNTSVGYEEVCLVFG